jgi:hypothetical protein
VRRSSACAASCATRLPATVAIKFSLKTNGRISRVRIHSFARPFSFLEERGAARRLLPPTRTTGEKRGRRRAASTLRAAFCWRCSSARRRTRSARSHASASASYARSARRVARGVDVGVETCERRSVLAGQLEPRLVDVVHHGVANAERARERVALALVRAAIAEPLLQLLLLIFIIIINVLRCSGYRFCTLGAFVDHLFQKKRATSFSSLIRAPRAPHARQV